MTNPGDTLLIFRLGSIGDTVVALPCFHAIARAYPRHRRVLLTNSLTSVRASSAESILNGTGLIHDVLYYPAGGFTLKESLVLRNQLKRISPSFLIYLAERATAATVFRDFAFFKAVGVPRIIGGPWNRKLRNCRIDPVTGELEYEAERLARTLGRVVTMDLDPRSWDLHLSPLEHAKADKLLDDAAGHRPLLAVAPGAKIAAKDWGVERWAELLTSVADEYRGAGLVLVGAQDERALCEDLSHHWKGPVVNLCGLLTPRETAAALGRCQLMVCHDSGPMHLAASQGTLCIALFGSYNQPRKWYPFGERHRVIHEPRGVREIAVQRVAGEIRALLERPRASASLHSVKG